MKRLENFSRFISISQAIDEYSVELQSDLITRRYVDSLADTVLEKDINRAIEPYSLIEVLSLFSIIFEILEVLEIHIKTHSDRI